MQDLGTTLKSTVERLRRSKLWVVLPEESVCPGGCGYFDVTYPEAARILHEHDPSGRLAQQCACRCKTEKDLQKAREELRWQETNLPHQDSQKEGLAKTFDNFIPRPGTEEMVQAARDFVKDQGPRVLVISGGTGSGKSHILEAIGRAVVAKGFTARYDLSSQLLDKLRSSYSPSEGDGWNSFKHLMDWYYTRYLLLLDDLGMEKPTDWAVERLTLLVDDRLTHGGRLVIATNKMPDDLTATMPRLRSRTFQSNRGLGEVRVVFVTAKDYRTERTVTSGL